MDKILQDKLDHETRNAILGMVLEVKHITECLKRLERHLTRVAVSCESCLSEISIVEKKEGG